MTRRAILWTGLGCAVWGESAVSALAQLSQRPFAVAGGEGGGGGEGGLTGWLMAQQSSLTHLIAGKVHALHGQPSAAWGLIGLGLAYGVVHAAGPGHGKAALASYMLANETSLKRGAAMALMAALLQALIAIVLVGAAGFVFQATASQMTHAADWIELASYCGVAAIGAWLVWRKGAALLAALSEHTERRRALASAPAYGGVAWERPAFSLSAAAYRAGAPDEPDELADECGHMHMPDPAELNGPFSWRAAAGTVIAAGARPCSGAILVLVFAMAQGLFAAGIAAALAMAIGTAVTTGALAWVAVFAKSTAMRLAAGENSRLGLVARGFEFAAALAVLAFGVALLVRCRIGAVLRPAGRHLFHRVEQAGDVRFDLPFSRHDFGRGLALGQRSLHPLHLVAHDVQGGWQGNAEFSLFDQRDQFVGQGDGFALRFGQAQHRVLRLP